MYDKLTSSWGNSLHPELPDRVGLLVVAILIVFSAASKTVALSTDEFAEHRYALPIGVLWASVVVELAFAEFLLFSRVSLATKLAAVSIAFLLLAVASLVRWMLGVQDCGCFSAVSIPASLAGIFCFGISLVAVFRIIQKFEKQGRLGGSSVQLLVLGTWRFHRKHSGSWNAEV